jgi:DNA polymerase
MYSACVQEYGQWREVARPLLSAGVAPEHIEWRAGTSFEHSTEMPAATPLRLSRQLIDLLESIACYRHPGRWELMYRLAWRSLRQTRLLEDAADPDVHHATKMAKAVDREVHKMHAFVRFRELEHENGEKMYCAWFEPTHEVLRLGVPFFCQRFPNMDWMIATPDGTHESLWRTYYRNICNVARINPPAMQRDMPKKYWHNLPEATEIHSLLRDGQANFAQRQREAIDAEMAKARAVQLALADLPDYSGGPAACRRCDIWRHATQAVLGEGSTSATIMLVGEQPGDEEDLRGRPFVGPAGKVLDEALRNAGLDRGELYITNAVKHFKWQPRGKRRLHKRPDAAEVAACNHWLDAEVEQIKPRIIVALGASALRAVAGLTDSIESARELQIPHASGAQIVCTYHPAAILRAEPTEAEALRQHLIADLRRAKELAA